MSTPTRTQRRALASAILQWARDESHAGHPYPINMGFCAVLAYGRFRVNPAREALHCAINETRAANLDSEGHGMAYLPRMLGLSGYDAKGRDKIRREYLRHWAETGEALTHRTWESRVGRAWNRKTATSARAEVGEVAST